MDGDTLPIPPIQAEAEQMDPGTLEKILSNASGNEATKGTLAEYARKLRDMGYLSGLFYEAKALVSTSGLEEAYKELRQSIDPDLALKSSSSSSWKKCADTETDWGAKVCKVLNHNIRMPEWNGSLKQSKYYTSTLVDGEYRFSWVQMPRNFTFVTEKLLGSSIPKNRDQMQVCPSLGITDIITVMENPLPEGHYVGLKLMNKESGAELKYHWYAVDDMGPPTTEQMKQMMAVIDSAKGKVLVHCRGGVGRTATVIAAHLMWEKGISKAEAVKYLMKRKTILTSTQEAFLSHWYREVALRPREGGTEAHVAEAVGPGRRSVGPGRRSVGPEANDGDSAENPIKIKNAQLPPVIMMVGYPASGKSSLAESLCRAYPDRVQRINQDELGKKECMARAGALGKKKGKNTLILDRCNLTRAERKEWLSIMHNPRKVWVIFMDVTPEECKWRIVRRRGHPGIKPGGGARIIESLAGKLEPPDSKTEGFEKVIRIATFEQSNALLQEWGAEKPESTMPSEEEEFGSKLLKFPRTRHVQNLGAATRDDLIMKPAEVQEFLNRPIYVEEKVDGANMGLSLRNYSVLVQNRSHYVTSSYHPQFKYLDTWVQQRTNDLWKILGSEEGEQEGSGRYILYGEWLYAKHSIPYDRLPDWFIAFDLWDRLEERFVSRKRLEARLRGTCIVPTPLIARERSYTSGEELQELVHLPSQFYDGKVEGVYLRICDDAQAEETPAEETPADEAQAEETQTEETQAERKGFLIKRGKIVRSDFMSGNEFWSKHGVLPNKKIEPTY